MIAGIHNFIYGALLESDHRRPSSFVAARALQVPPENQVRSCIRSQIRRLELAVAMRAFVSILIAVPNEQAEYNIGYDDQQRQ
jgi:hypothetical protein